MAVVEAYNILPNLVSIGYLNYESCLYIYFLIDTIALLHSLGCCLCFTLLKYCRTKCFFGYELLLLKVRKYKHYRFTSTTSINMIKY